ncbi:aminotransferase class V-fold PLP-dependent enzyme [Longirhabdus pacifica]|uniref:aminotransferase class V-fold PLP-dependent enzyme n=1 Tax=Longirhabdus pacifica TaxID=2305227 RepID=UPI0010093C3D|nr:aminotransferase class V-fold PLP-dependent enzyme [Longirhabdus pacifica]
MSVIYLDHAASSWPKPAGVVDAMVEAVTTYGANPGRGSHQLAVQASRKLFQTRSNIAKLCHIRNPNDIVFTKNTTEALNLAILGFVKEQDHVVCTTVEHNSVRRPLEHLKQQKDVSVTYVQGDKQGHVDVQKIKEAINSKTALIICSHSSNLLGTISPIKEIGALAKEKGIVFLVDAAQTIGVLPIDVVDMNIHLLAFPGHKSLLGPQGTGGLYVHNLIDLEPILYGGTGSQSELIHQPTVRPDRYESGTANTPGIAGWNEGVLYVQKKSIQHIYDHEWKLTEEMMRELNKIKGVSLLGPSIDEKRTGVVAFQMEGMDASEVAFILDQHYSIAVRSGYHCSPLAHETAGSIDNGAIRASVGYCTTEEEVESLIRAVKEISHAY